LGRPGSRKRQVMTTTAFSAHRLRDPRAGCTASTADPAVGDCHPALNRDLGSAGGLRLGRACIGCGCWICETREAKWHGRGGVPRPGGDAEERTGLGEGERVGEDEQNIDAVDRGYRDTEGDAEERTGWAAIPRASTLPAADQPVPGSLAGDSRRGDEGDHCSPFRRARSALCSAKGSLLYLLLGRAHRPRKRGSESFRSPANHRGLTCSTLWTRIMPRHRALVPPASP
jgi:hypothetical protein